MKTIGVKELRLRLDEVFDRALNGEDIVVSHRFKKPIRLSAVQDSSSVRKHQPLAGLQAFTVATKKPSPFNSTKPLKELYYESISHKYSK